MLCFVAAAVYCQRKDLPYLEDSMVRFKGGILIAYGITVQYQCLDGELFEDGTNTTAVTCVGNGYWEKAADLSSCSCKCVALR
jgi:hypothetical protein